MRWRNVRLILKREVLDQLRDRRTLFMVAILPLLLYPALGIGMVQMTVLFSEQPRTVVVLGTENLPEPPLIDGNRFVANWFTIGEHAETLRVISDQPAGADDEDSAVPQDSEQILTDAARIREVLEQSRSLDEQVAHAEAAEELALREQLAGKKVELNRLFRRSNIQVLLIIPDGFATDLEQRGNDLTAREAGTSVAIHDDFPHPVIIQNSADEKSLIAFRRVEEVLDSWEREILRRQLSNADLPQSLTSPVNAAEIDLAEDGQLAANLWSKLFPALLIIMALTGAFYPAVDLAAGEKERGTMETLLICPATRTEIVLGKFFTVMAFSVSTALLNLLSMGITGRYMVTLAGAASKVADLSVPPLSALIWVGVLLIPLAALFSALCLALATFARSSKEGQYYLTPLLVVTMGLTVFCLSPAVEINAFYSVMPVVGAALLLKALLLSGGGTFVLYAYAVPVLATSVVYSFLALWWAVEQFSSEEVLFREAERFDLRLWLRHLLRDKEPTPSFAEAGFCFILIMLMQFGALKFMQEAMRGAGGATDLMMMQLLMIQQLVIIASPALFMGVMLTTSVRATFRLYLPKLTHVIAAAALALALHPLTLELSASLSWFFPPLPNSIVETLAAMSSDDFSLWFVLLTFAAAPAVCEEFAFRGFILRGFERARRAWLGIVLSALTFGVMHMIPQQVFNAGLLGLVLGLIAVRTGSLVPGIVFHFVYNSAAVLHGRARPLNDPKGLSEWFVTFNESGLRYQFLLLLICAAVATFLLIWIFRQRGLEGVRSPADTTSGSPGGERLAGERPMQDTAQAR